MNPRVKPKHSNSSKLTWTDFSIIEYTFIGPQGGRGSKLQQIVPVKRMKKIDLNIQRHKSYVYFLALAKFTTSDRSLDVWQEFYQLFPTDVVEISIEHNKWITCRFKFPFRCYPPLPSFIPSHSLFPVLTNDVGLMQNEFYFQMSFGGIFELHQTNIIKINQFIFCLPITFSFLLVNLSPSFSPIQVPLRLSLSACIHVQPSFLSARKLFNFHKSFSHL